jgi:clan AA aspartic protease
VIRGTFRNEAARATLTLISTAGGMNIEFVVDTGFTGMLALPSAVLNTVGATLEGLRLVQLADGTRRRVPFYSVQVDWGGSPRRVRATSLEDEPLIGVGLLRGHDLQIEVIEGGKVAADPIRTP